MRNLDKGIVRLDAIVLVFATILFIRSENQIRYVLLLIVLSTLILSLRYYFQRYKDLKYIREMYPDLLMCKMSQSHFLKFEPSEITFCQLDNNTLKKMNDKLELVLELSDEEVGNLHKTGYISTIIDKKKYIIERL